MRKLFMTGLLVSSVLAVALSPSVALGKAEGLPQSSVTTKSEFHDAMRKLWEDHIIWTRQVIVDAFATGPGLPDLSFALTRLLANQDDIGNAIKPYYGDAAGNQLTALLHIHINTAGAILFDLKSGNTTALNADIAAWYSNANDIAVFLNSANPNNWPLAETQAMMKHHLDDTTAEVLARFQSRWADDIAAFDTVQGQILMMADFLSDGIMAQFPQDFNHGFSK